MNLENIIWLRDVVDKLWSKHTVSQGEVEEALASRPQIRLLKRATERVKMFTKRLAELMRAATWRFFSSTKEANLL